MSCNVFDSVNLEHMKEKNKSIYAVLCMSFIL